MMKNKILIIFSLITSLSFSQQVVKKVTATQVSILALANGSSLTNTCGNINIDIGNSDNWGNISIYTNTNVLVSKNETVAVFTTLPDEVVGNSTFIWDANTQSKTVNTLPNPNVLLSFFTKRGRGRCDANIGYDGIITIVDIPYTQTDGSAIPNGTKIRIDAPQIINLTNGSVLSQGERLWFEWNGSNWLPLLTSPGGVTLPVLEDWGMFLSNQDYSDNKQIKIYPNPTSNYIKIQNSKSSSENYEYKILDLTGRIVKSGNSKFSEEINIENLQSENYIIQIKNENGEIFNQKLIKK